MVKLSPLTIDVQFYILLDYIQSGHAELARITAIRLFRMARKVSAK